MFKGTSVVLGVTGGIAAYKAAELLRQLILKGADVSVVMTRHAQEFVAPLTFQVLSRNRVITDMFALEQEVDIKHISLAERADLVLVAPATANIIGKFANGVADDFLSTFLISTLAPIVIAPAMNTNMYNNAAVQENISRLRERGVEFVEPEYGELAEGTVGVGRLAAIEVILQRCADVLSRGRDLSGKTVLVTAGPTQEPLDPVRHITNRSSGRMGFALAAAARRRGASVTLVSGPTHLEPPQGVSLIPVRTAEEMRSAVLEHLTESHIVIKAAAVADYRPRTAAAQKLKKGAADLTLEMERTPDILAEVGRNKGNRFLVGFAAETENLAANAMEKIKEKNLDLIVVNDVSRDDVGFASSENQVQIITRNGHVEELPRMPKTRLADLILDRIVSMLSIS